MVVAFDLDDTLYKERDYVASGTQVVHQRLRQLHPLMNESEIASHKWDDADLAAYRNHYPDISLDAEVAATLQSLRQHGATIAIITDGRSISQRQKFKALGLDSYVQGVDLIISEEISADKTTPLPFAKLMERHPLEKDWIYVGDNPAKDFFHPKQLGWTTVMIADTQGVNIHTQDLTLDLDYHPAIILNHVSQLLDILENH